MFTKLVSVSFALALMGACGSPPPPKPAPQVEDACARKKCEHGCKDGSCIVETKVAAPPAVECDETHACRGANETCQNGHCVAPPRGGPGCTDFPAPDYAFESPELSAASKATLTRLAKCLAGPLKGARVLLTGHCDARGEYEFNMGLGAERAEGAKKFLIELGVPAADLSTSSRGKLDASGQDEPGYTRDRRVDIEVR